MTLPEHTLLTAYVHPLRPLLTAMLVGRLDSVEWIVWNGIVDWNTGMPRPLSLSQCRAYPPAWPKVLAELTRYTDYFGHLIQHSALFWSGEPHSLLTSLTTIHSTVYHIAGNLRERKLSRKRNVRKSFLREHRVRATSTWSVDYSMNPRMFSRQNLHGSRFAKISPSKLYST